jgi:hypothetical protein
LSFAASSQAQVCVGAAQHDGKSLISLCHVPPWGDRGQRCCSAVLDDDAPAIPQQCPGSDDLGLVDEDGAYVGTAGHVEAEVADAAGTKSVGRDAGDGDICRLACVQCGSKRRSGLGLDRDDLSGQTLESRGDAGHQTSTAACR